MINRALSFLSTMTIMMLLSFPLNFQVLANSDSGLTIVAIGEAEREVEKVFIDGLYKPQALTPAQALLGTEMVEVIKNDFSFYKKYFSVERGKDISGAASSGVTYSQYESSKVSILIKVEVTPVLTTDLKVKVMAWNLGKKEQILEQSFDINKTNLRSKTHLVNNDIYKAITGKESIFTSKIVFVSDRDGTRANPIKELYMMDFDGRNKTRMTWHKGTVISPAISHDQKKIVYSLIQGTKSRKRNVNLYVYDMETKQGKLMSSRKGINSGAIFMPGDKEILLTLSFGGNAEIYAMNIQSRALRRITRHFSLDVDPSINNEGSLLAFLSGRSGKAMIYTMDPTGVEKNVKRISYVGQYNATPRFSPDGREIVFSSWLDERFDLFRINADGSGLSRLTKDFGSNEDPTYSNDGEFIAFSSQRVLSRIKATHNIYIMDKDGDIMGSLTKGFGNCITPRWSK